MRKLTIILLLFLSFSAIAQDKIVKKSGNIIDCKVTEISADEVKYYYSGNPKLIFGVDKALVEKVEFATGEVIKIESNSFKNVEYYANQSTRALKINFLSPLNGSTELVYEQNVKPGKSWETSLGLIGLGVDAAEINPVGVYAKFAYKFFRDPDFYIQKMHYAHILKGAYIAPEIAFRYMKYDSYDYKSYYSYNYNQSKSRAESFGFALILKFGKQWVFDDSFLVDWYCGIGYGIGGDDGDALNYGFVAGTDDMPIAITGGVRVGWVF